MPKMYFIPFPLLYFLFFLDVMRWAVLFDHILCGVLPHQSPDTMEPSNLRLNQLKPWAFTLFLSHFMLMKKWLTKVCYDIILFTREKWEEIVR
jgi:hypothetical protein